MSCYHYLRDISIRDGVLDLKIDGKNYRFPLSEVSETLASATEEEIAQYEVSPGGYGIHWPLLDEDISIDGLLGVKHSPGPHRESA